MKMSAERVAELATMCDGIAKANAYKFADKTADQLAEDLLWKLWKEQEKSEKLLDLPLCAVICHKEVINLQRKGAVVTKHEVSKEFVEEDNVDNSAEITRETKSFAEATCNEYVGVDLDSKIMVEDLLNRFPKNTREYTFLHFWATKAGIIENEFDETCVKFNESELARVLGYTGTGNSSFKKFRSEMRTFIAEYFGL